MTKTDDQLWGNRFRINIYLKEHIVDNHIDKILYKLNKFSNTLAKHEQPEKFIIKKKSNLIIKDSFDNWKNEI